MPRVLQWIHSQGPVDRRPGHSRQIFGQRLRADSQHEMLVVGAVIRLMARTRGPHCAGTRAQCSRRSAADDLALSTDRKHLREETACREVKPDLDSEGAIGKPRSEE